MPFFLLPEKCLLSRFCPIWGVAKGSSVSWVAKFRGDKNSECKLSNGWSRSYKVIKLLLSAGKWVVAKLQGDKSASRSSMELCYPWISGPLRVSWLFIECKKFRALIMYTFSLVFPRKRYTWQHHSFFFFSVTSGSVDRQREEGCHGGGVYFISTRFLHSMNRTKS